MFWRCNLHKSKREDIESVHVAWHTLVNRVECMLMSVLHFKLIDSRKGVIFPKTQILKDSENPFLEFEPSKSYPKALQGRDLKQKWNQKSVGPDQTHTQTVQVLSFKRLATPSQIQPKSKIQKYWTMMPMHVCTYMWRFKSLRCILIKSGMAAAHLRISDWTDEWQGFLWYWYTQLKSCVLTQLHNLSSINQRKIPE